MKSSTKSTLKAARLQLESAKEAEKSARYKRKVAWQRLKQHAFDDEKIKHKYRFAFQASEVALKNAISDRILAQRILGEERNIALLRINEARKTLERSL